MDAHRKKVLIIASVVFALAVVFGGFGYAGSQFVEVERLVREGDQLKAAGDFAAAKGKYEAAQQKQTWPSAQPIDGKIATITSYIEDDAQFEAGEAAFGKGEWQKCLEYLGQVATTYPRYGASTSRYADCQKKLDEEAAAAEAKAAEEQAEKEVADQSTSAAATTTKPKAQSGGSGGQSVLDDDCVARIAEYKPASVQPLTPEQAARIQQECFSY